MAKKVRFRTAVPTTFYDARHDVLVHDIVSVDTKGRRWQRRAGGADVLLDSPNEPAKRQRRKAIRIGNS